MTQDIMSKSRLDQLLTEDPKQVQRVERIKILMADTFGIDIKEFNEIYDSPAAKRCVDGRWTFTVELLRKRKRMAQHR